MDPGDVREIAARTFESRRRCDTSHQVGGTANEVLGGSHVTPVRRVDVAEHPLALGQDLLRAKEIDEPLRRFDRRMWMKRHRIAVPHSQFLGVHGANVVVQSSVISAVVPLAPEFVRQFDEIVRNHQTEAAYYGHASVGCLHIRPVVSLKSQDGVDKMVSIADEISDLVKEFGGSLSGEHGDGIVRGVWNEKMFGPEVYKLFQELKGTFDPDGILVQFDSGIES